MSHSCRFHYNYSATTSSSSPPPSPPRPPPHRHRHHCSGLAAIDTTPKDGCRRSWSGGGWGKNPVGMDGSSTIISWLADGDGGGDESLCTQGQKTVGRATLFSPYAFSHSQRKDWLLTMHLNVKMMIRCIYTEQYHQYIDVTHRCMTTTLIIHEHVHTLYFSEKRPEQKSIKYSLFLWFHC